MESTIGGFSPSTTGGSNPYYWVCFRCELFSSRKDRNRGCPLCPDVLRSHERLRSKSIVGRQSSMKNCARLAVWALACLIFGSVSVHAQNITTVVGGGPVGLSPTGGSIGSPVAVHRDTSNNAYILDNTYSRVIKVDATTGLMSVYAGNGTTGFSGDG